MERNVALQETLRKDGQAHEEKSREMWKKEQENMAYHRSMQLKEWDLAEHRRQQKVVCESVRELCVCVCVCVCGVCVCVGGECLGRV